MKPMVVGGLHGDEPTGVIVAKRCGGIVANPEAVKANKRFLETDMNRSFGVDNPISLEERAAIKVLKRVEKNELVVDIHNTKARNCTCAIVVAEPSVTQIKLAQYFGMERIVVMPPGGSLIANLGNKAISLEYSETGFENDLVMKIEKFCLENLPVKNTKIYKYAGKVGQLTLERLEIEKNELGNFEILPGEIRKKFGLKEPKYCPFFLKYDSKEEVAFTLLEEV